jgi:hypothetical protein
MNNSKDTIRKGDHVTETNPSPFPEIDKFVSEFLKTRKVHLIVSLLFVKMNYSVAFEKQYSFNFQTKQTVYNMFSLELTIPFHKLTNCLKWVFSELVETTLQHFSFLKF